jgi:hypothetical protein
MSHSSMRTSLASFACTNTEYALTPKLALVSVGEGGRTCRREHQRRSQGRVVGPRSEQLDVERKRVRVYKQNNWDLINNLELLRSATNSEKRIEAAFLVR